MRVLRFCDGNFFVEVDTFVIHECFESGSPDRPSGETVIHGYVNVSASASEETKEPLTSQVWGFRGVEDLQLPSKLQTR